MRTLTLILAAFLPLGCQKPADPLYPVSGLVTLNGKALHKGDIVFVPDASKGNTHLQFGMGKIARDGTYAAHTINHPGVKAGWYKIMVLATENEPQESLSWVPIWLVPLKYTKPESTDLVVEIGPEREKYDVELRSQ